MRKKSVTIAIVVLLPALLVLTSSLVSAKHHETISNEARVPLSGGPGPARTTCQMVFNLKGWSAFYKTSRGTGTITCDNGQKATVNIEAKGGGLTAGKGKIADGLGKFSAVADIKELFGTYVQAGASAGAGKSAEATVMTKREVSLALTGKGTGIELVVSFGKFTITKR